MSFLPTFQLLTFLLDEIWFYIVLTDGVGTFRLSVELFGIEDVVLAKSEPHPVTFAGGAQLGVQELRIPMESVPFARPGLYEFKLAANHVHLEERGTALLRVLPG